MRYSIMLVLCSLVVSQIGWCADVRNISWGMERHEVIQAHSEFGDDIDRPPSRGPIMFPSKYPVETRYVHMIERNFVLAYEFMAGGLFRITYRLDEQHVLRQEDLINYEYLSKVLEKKYGEYAEHIDNAQRDRSGATVRRVWDIANTHITLQMADDTWRSDNSLTCRNIDVIYQAKKDPEVKIELKEGDLKGF